MLDILYLNPLRGALEENTAGALDQGKGRHEDHNGDGKAGGRVGVEAIVAFGKGDHDGGDDDTHVIEGVSRDVQENSKQALVSSGRFGLE